MKLIHLILIGSLFLGACTQEYEDTLQVPETNAGVSENVSIIENYLSKTHRGLTRGENYTLIPWIVEGDTVMYIANYGEGWEVFSNDTRVPMVLMKSENGSFYPNVLDRNSPFEELFQNTAVYLNELKKIQELPTDTINGEWKAYVPESLSTHTMNVEPGDDDQYYWKYIGSSVPEEIHENYTPSGGRLKTKWHQDEFFNSCTPYINGKHTKLGCIAVALGQYFYFTHYKDNRPAQTVTDAVYDKIRNVYNFSGSSSTIWDSFKLKDYYWETEESMMPTAIFLGWIGKSVDMEYGLDGSYTDPLANKTINFFNSQTGLNAIKSIFSESYAVNILKKGYPVLTRATSSKNLQYEIGHTWLIDYYVSDYTSYNDFYIYVKDSEDDGGNPGEEPDLDIDFFNHATTRDIQRIFGNVPVDVVPNAYRKAYFKCNWGWDDIFDEVLFDADVLTWDANGYKFREEFWMYRF